MTTSESRVIERFAGLYPEEVARIMDPFPPEDNAGVMDDTAPTAAAAVIQRLTLHTGAEVLERMDADHASRVVELLEPHRAAAFLLAMPEEISSRILNGASTGCQRELRTLMEYPPESAGRLMEPLVTTLFPESTVEQALERVQGLFPRRVFDVFLVNPDGVLVGVAHLQDIATSRSGTRLSEIATRDVPRVRDTAGPEDVVATVQAHGVLSLPVVDFADRVIGVLRYESLISNVEREASVDIQKMVGVSKDENALSSAGFAVRKRLPWLQINLATAFLAASVVGLFEETIAGFTALAVMLPVVAGQSGNTGAQALAVIMRGLALREITPRQAPRVLTKEVTVATLNGIAVAAVTAIGVLAWSRSIGLAAVTAVAMVWSMACAGLSGAAIPLILRRLNQDPAQSSSIVLTTVTDIVGFLSFLGLATIFFAFL